MDTSPGSYYGSPPRYGGQGSGAGPVSANPYISRGVAGWEPTTLNLVILIVFELAAYVALRWVFRTAHGG